MTVRAVVATVVLAVLGAACWVGESGPNVERARPPNVRIERAQGRGTGRDDRDSAPVARTHTAIPQAGSLQDVALPSLETSVRTTPQGLTLAFDPVPRPLADRFVVHFTLTIPHAPDTPGDPHAVAALTALVIAEAPRVEEDRPSLRVAIADLGGRLDLGVDGVATRFRIGVMHGLYREALQELFSAVARSPTRPQIEAVQNNALIDLSERLAADPIGGVLRRVVAVPTGTRHPLDALQDVSRAQVVLFHRNSYKPAGAMLTIADQASAEKRLDEAQELAEAWATSFEPSLPTPIAPATRPDIVLWAPGAQPATLAMLWDVPPAAGAETVPMLVAIEHVTDSAPSGLVARALAPVLGEAPEIGIRWLDNGPAQALALTTPCDPARVAAAAAAVRAAIAGLAERQPRPAELEAAAARVRLRLLREREDPRLAAAATARALAIAPSRPPTASWDAIEALARPELDLAAAFGVLASRPPTFVVAGGEPPADAAPAEIVSPFEMRSEFELAVPRADIEAQTYAAQVFLDLATQAIGGKERLAEIKGCYGKSQVRTGRGPDAIDFVFLDFADQRFRRIRQVLATTIDTIVERDSAREYAGDQVIELSAEQIDAIVSAIDRQPLLLLAAYARGETRYRLISTRRAEDRTLAVVELVDPKRPRLRMHIDTESGLVRVVDTVEYYPEVGALTLTEHFRDYRQTQGAVGMRFPYHVTTVIDDGVAGRIRSWIEFFPVRPPAEAFQRPK